MSKDSPFTPTATGSPRIDAAAARLNEAFARLEAKLGRLAADRDALWRTLREADTTLADAERKVQHLLSVEASPDDEAAA